MAGSQTKLLYRHSHPGVDQLQKMPHLRYWSGGLRYTFESAWVKSMTCVGTAFPLEPYYAQHFPKLCGHLTELRSCVKVEVAVPLFPVPNSPYGLCGRKATLNLKLVVRTQELCESRSGRPGALCP